MIAAISFALAALAGTDPAVGDGLSSGPHCGLLCVLAASNAIDRPISFAALLDERYLTADYGSTADDLCRALADNGLVGEPRSNMTASHLRAAQSPLILHTRTPQSGLNYHHWVLFLGMADGKAMVYDPPYAVSAMSVPELLSLWDGYGVVVRQQSDGGGWWRWPPLPLNWFASLATVAAVLTAGRRWRVPPWQVIPLASACAAAAAGALPDGLCHGFAGLQSVIAAHFRHTVRTVEYADLDEPATVLVDARLQPAYKRGHIPGAVNVPVNVSHAQLVAAIDAIPSDRRVVVYCQSEACGWADQIAAQFAARGRPEVYVYRGGYNGWLGQTGQGRAAPSRPGAAGR